MTLENPTCSTKGLLLSQLILASGLIISAFTLGYQTKTIGSGRSTVTIKGVAEKPVKADSAEWSITANAHGKTFADAVKQLRENKKKSDYIHRKTRL